MERYNGIRGINNGVWERYGGNCVGSSNGWEWWRNLLRQTERDRDIFRGFQVFYAIYNCAREFAVSLLREMQVVPPVKSSIDPTIRSGPAYPGP